MKKNIDELLIQGIKAHKERNLNEAERLYREILKKTPSHPDANHNIGVLALEVGKFDEALTFIEKAVANNPHKEQYWLSLIELLIKLGKISRARNVLSGAIKIGFDSKKLKSISLILNPSKKLDFFYKYLQSIGIFNSQENEIVNGDGETIPLLTTSFLNWFETQEWSSMDLLEFGAGGSTLYFSKFFKSVTSFETDQNWYDKIFSKKRNNVNLVKVDSIFESLKVNKININKFNVISIDTGENRAKITRLLINQNYKGIIFFDNSNSYRNSIGLFLNEEFIEVPFFGLKPIDDSVSCTSLIVEPSKMKKIFNGNWTSFPKLMNEISDNSWDDEGS